MDSRVSDRMNDMDGKRKKRRLWKRIVACAACAVVFCTTYALILPAITMEESTYCGQEEHTHTEACYTRELVCGLEESELPVHTHTDACYETTEELVCTVPESEGHTHTDTCYDAEGNLICGQAESEGHHHTEACYQENRVLICTQQEAAQETHQHTDACYQDVLTCGKEEHTHTLSCYSDPNADLEAQSQWEATLPGSLSGKWDDDVIAIAKSQLGYTESARNYTVLEDGTTKRGYTRYGAWYGDPYGDWCAMFASFCLRYADVPDSSFPIEASCPRWIQKLADRKLYADAGSYTPKTGDLVFFDYEQDGTSDHVGIVESVDGSTLHTIEGNSGNQVKRNTYALSDSDIQGYGILPVEEDSDAEPGSGAAEEAMSAEDDTSVAVHDAHDTVQISVSTTQSSYHDPKTAEDGTLLFYTGESAVTTLSISNPTSSTADDGAVVRLYMKFDKAVPASGNESSDGKIPLAPGTYTITASSGTVYNYTVTKVEEPGTYCYEIQRPLNGDTLSLELASTYTSPTSAGGTNEVWGVILTKEEKDALDAEAGEGKIGIAPKPEDGSNQQTIRWETSENTFDLTKEQNGSPRLVGDGENGAYIADLSYQIDLTRNANTQEGVGLDYIKQVEFTDVITLPENAELTERLLQIVTNGEYTATWVGYSNTETRRSWYLKDQDKNIICRITFPDDYSSDSIYHPSGIPTPTLSITEDGKLAVKWTVLNQSTTTIPEKEISELKATVVFGNDIFQIKEVQENTDYTISNSVTADEYYSWAGKKPDTKQCDITLRVGESDLKLEKIKTKQSTDFGTAMSYQIKASNAGVLSYDKLGFVEDTLENHLYLSASDLAAMFSDPQHGEQLTVSILNATLCTPPTEKTVYGIDGKPLGVTAVGDTSADGNPNKYQGLQSKDPTELTNSALITLKMVNGQVEISCGDQTVSCAAEQASIQSALNSLGFVIVRATQYKLSWDLRNEDGTAYSMRGGEEFIFNLPCTIKSTYMRLSADERTNYHSSYETLHQNTAYAYGVADADDGTEVGEQLKSASCDGNNLFRECSISKSATTEDGSSMTTAPAEGSTVTYQLRASSYNTADTGVLPLTDHMSGAQALLAEVSKNKDAAWAESLTEDDIFRDASGTEYYILSAAGTYSGVWLNGQYADSVQVSETAAGRDTLIKFYLPNRRGTVKYQALVCPTRLNPNALGYSLGNETWLNDHETHRLYDSIGGVSASLISFDKKIVSEDDIAAQEKEPGTTYEPVGETQTVYYRFTFYPRDDQSPYTLSGSDLVDALPLGLSKDETDYLKWEKSEAMTPGSVWIMGYQGYTSLENGDHYGVESDANVENQQNIVWDHDFSISVGSEPVYIYVRLTFPEGDNWQEYAAKYSNTELQNTLYVQSARSTVTHQLKVAAKAYLQKGVYAVPSYSLDTGAQAPMLVNREKDALYYYNNTDSMYRTVSYYAVLYNGGNTRLYIQDMQDILPKGFTIIRVTDAYSIREFNNWDYRKTKLENVYISTADPAARQPHGYTRWKAFYLTATVDADNPQKVTFHVEGQKGNSSYISYDEEQELYYLSPGEGIVFNYECATNGYADTEDTAVNSIAMPYYDFNEGGVEISNTPFERLYNSPPLDMHFTGNDGSCDLMTNEQAEATGRTGVSNDTQWLESNVTVVRGGIKPGLTKSLDSAISTNGTVQTAPIVAAHPADTLRWKITADNDGYVPMNDYVLTDTMQAPFVFSGQVNYTIQLGDLKNNIAGQAADGYLFEIAEHDDGTILLTSNNGETAETTVDAEPISLNVSWIPSASGTAVTVPILVQVTKNVKTGNHSLSIRFQDSAFAIPEGSYSVLYVDTKNISNNLLNKVLVNTSYLTPMLQQWNGNVNKGNLTTLDPQGQGEKPTVRNSAPVTITYGYTTGSDKSVEEKGSSTKASSSSTKNYITLSDKQKLFTYILTVENSEKPLDSMILIDGLPEVGDHSSFQDDDPRYSEFRVKFAETPNVTVTVKTSDGKTTKLTEDQYTVEYSEKTEFDKDDWAGTSEWSGSSADARSIRVKILDSTGTVLPAKSTLSVRFDAQIDGDAEPGQIAWNSFGYHYRVLGDAVELEAAPLKVGVQAPYIPKIQKQLVNVEGSAVAAPEDVTFRFLFYSGFPVSGKTADEHELGKLIASSTRKATIVEVTVPKGSTESPLIQLDHQKEYTYQNGSWTETEKDLVWYSNFWTVVELGCDNPAYSFLNFSNSTQPNGAYYANFKIDSPLTIIAKNQMNVWDFTIAKTDAGDQTPLAGAWFALYSPEAGDRLSEEDYNALTEKPTVKPEDTIEQNGQTWYLTSVTQTSNADGAKGTLVWKNLVQDQYLYQEIQAPRGYQLDDTVYIAKKTVGNHKVTVPNQGTGYSLPETGGRGTRLYYMLGSLAVMAAALLLSWKRRRIRQRGSD